MHDSIMTLVLLHPQTTQPRRGRSHVLFVFDYWLQQSSGTIKQLIYM